MPAQLQYFDMEVITELPKSVFEHIPITQGPNWQPNDIRLVFVTYDRSKPASDGSLLIYNPQTVPPSGFTTAYAQSGSDYGRYIFYLFWQRFAPGFTQSGYLNWNVTGLRWLTAAFITVRGVDPATNPTGASAGFTAQTTDPFKGTLASVSVPFAGAAVLFANSYPGNYLGAGAGPSVVQGCSLNVPVGWTHLVSTPGSGPDFRTYAADLGILAAARNYASSGSTGPVVIPTGWLWPAWEQNSVGTTATVVFVKPAPDVTTSAGDAVSTSTATAGSSSSGNSPHSIAGQAVSRSSATTAFNPLRGYWISDPLLLDGSPVTGSVVRWARNTPAGSTVTVETSINNGASWDLATNNRQVPRLREGDGTTRNVLTRITLTRTSATGGPPTVPYLELRVSLDSGTYELVPIGHGFIEEASIKTASGSTGGGSSSSGGGAGVTGKGGGQSGGGTSIDLHAVDLSAAIKLAGWEQPFIVPVGVTYGEAVKLMVRDRLPSQEAFSIASTEHVVKDLLVYGLEQGQDPWQDIRELAAAVGCECFFDAAGVCVFRPVPDPRRGEPVWVFGVDANPIVDSKRQLTAKQVRNYIVAKGESMSSMNPVCAVAFDADPSSRTYVGKIGKRVQRLTFPKITTQVQAQAAADATLYNSLGVSDTVTITVAPMPGLEPGDPVEVNVPDADVAGTYVINSMTTSLSPAEGQQLVCFRQTTNTGG